MPTAPSNPAIDEEDDDLTPLPPPVQPDEPDIPEVEAQVDLTARRQRVDRMRAQRAPAPSTFDPLATPQGEARAVRAAAQGEADAMADVRAEQRAAVIAKRRTDLVQKKTRNATLEAEMRGTGQQFYTDAFGDIQPVIEAGTGRALYSQTPWEDGGKHPQTGEPTLVKRDQYGQRQYKAPQMVASSDLADTQLYYKYADDDLRPAGEIAAFKAHKNPTIARLAKRTDAARRQAAWKEAILPMEAAKLAVDSEYDSAQQRNLELQGQIDTITAQMQGAPSPQLESQMQALVLEQADLQEKLKPMGALGRMRRTAALDLSIFKAKASHESYLDLAEERRDILKAQGKSEANDPILKSILAAQATYGKAIERAATVAQREAAVMGQQQPAPAAPAEVGTVEGLVNTGHRAALQSGAGLNVLGAERRLGKQDEYSAQAAKLEQQASQIDALQPGWSPERRAQWAERALTSAAQLRQRAAQMAESAGGEMASAADRLKRAAAITGTKVFEDYQGAKGWDAVAKFLSDPAEIASNIAVEGTLGSLPAMAAGAAGAVAGGIPGAAAGLGLGSFATEYANSLTEAMAEAGVDVSNPQQIGQAFQDPEVMERARRNGVARGIPVALFDAFSGGIAGRTVGPVVGSGVRKIIAAGAREVGEQAALGMAGETAGQVSEQLAETGAVSDLSMKDVVAEGLGELVPGAGQVAMGAAVRSIRDRGQNPGGPTDGTTGTQGPDGTAPADTVSTPAALTPEQQAAEAEFQRRLSEPEEVSSEAAIQVASPPAPQATGAAAQGNEAAVASPETNLGVVGSTQDTRPTAPGTEEAKVGAVETPASLAPSGELEQVEIDPVPDRLEDESQPLTTREILEYARDDRSSGDDFLAAAADEMLAEIPKGERRNLSLEDRRKTVAELERRAKLIEEKEGAVDIGAPTGPARSREQVAQTVRAPEPAERSVEKSQPTTTDALQKQSSSPLPLQPAPKNREGVRGENVVDQGAPGSREEEATAFVREVGSAQPATLDVEFAESPAEAAAVGESETAAASRNAPGESESDRKFREQGEKFDRELAADRQREDEEMAKRPVLEQDPHFWVRKEIEKRAIDKGLSPAELREMDPKIYTTLRAMIGNALKRQVTKRAPIHKNALATVTHDFGIKLPKGYELKGDTYIFTQPTIAEGQRNYFEKQRAKTEADLARAKQVEADESARQAKVEADAEPVIAALRAVEGEKNAAGIAEGRGGNIWSGAVDGKFTADQLKAARSWIIRNRAGDSRLQNAIEGATTIEAAPAPISAAITESTPETVEGQTISKEWTSFAPDSGTLGIPRAEMPQVKSEARGALVNFLRARDIPARAAMIAPTKLKPTQAEFSPAKVEDARKHTGPERPILISSDGHVVDGHHQWVAALDDPTTPMPVIRLNAPIDRVLAEMKEFPSTESAGGVAAKAAPKEPSVSQPAEKRLSDRAIAALKSAKIHKPGTTAAATPLSLAWDGAIDLAILGVRAGRAVADVVKLAIDRFKAKYPGHTPDDLTRLEADIRKALAESPPADDGAKKKSLLPESLKEAGAPVESIEYEVRAQEARRREASDIVAKEGTTKAEDLMVQSDLPGDTRVAIGGQLINERMLALKEAKPEDVGRITKDIQRITAKMQPELATEAGQTISMLGGIYKDVRVASAMEYVKEATAQRLERMGGKEVADVAQEAATALNKAKAPEERQAAIDKLKEKYTTKPARRVLDTLAQAERARELNKLGVLTRDDLLEVAGNALGLPGISQQKLKRLAEIADRIEKAPNRAERSKAELELAEALTVYKGVNALDLEMSMLTASILAGPTTQFASVEGNALQAIAQLGTVAAVNPTRVPTLLKGIMQGIPLGLTQGRSILQTGRGTRDFQDKTMGAGNALNLVDYTRDYGLPAPVGNTLTVRARLLEKVFRLMKAVDATFYYPAREAYARLAADKLLSANYSGAELGKKVDALLHTTPTAFEDARKQAVAEGYEGIDLARRVSDIIEERRAQTPDGATVVKQSEQFAAETTFTNEPVGLAGVAYRNLSRLVGEAQIAKIQVLKPWLMFLKTPANVFNATTNFSPMGAVRAHFGVQGDKFRRGGTGEGQWRHFNRDERHRLYLQSVIGTSLMAGMIYRILDKEDVDVTASGPADPAKKKQLMQGGWIPYSVTIDGKRRSYKDSPLLVPLAIVGHVADSVKYQKSNSDLVLESKVADAIAHAPQIIFQTSMLSGLSDLMSALSGRGSGPESIGRTLGSIPANLVIPYNRLLQQVDQSFDDTTYKNNPVVGAVPFARRTGTPQTDVQGRPQRYDPWSRFGSTENNDPVDSLIREKNVFIPDVGKDVKLGDKVMTDEQRDAYRRISGQRIRIRIQAIAPRLRVLTQEKAQDEIDAIAREEREKVKPLVRAGVGVRR